MMFHCPVQISYVYLNEIKVVVVVVVVVVVMMTTQIVEISFPY